VAPQLTFVLSETYNHTLGFGDLQMIFKKMTCALVFAASPWAAPPAMAQSYQANVRGLMMSCTSYYGEPVMIIVNDTLPDLGVAHRNYDDAPAIELNPRATRLFSAIVAQWWFLHECAHHALSPSANNETSADCFAIRQLRDYGLLQSPVQLREFQQQLSGLEGTRMGHLPGPLRVQNLIDCVYS
jgi:hypothetical protein